MKTEIIRANFKIGSHIKTYSKKQLKLKKKHRKPQKAITQMSVDFVLKHVPIVRLMEKINIHPFGVFLITNINNLDNTMVATPAQVTYHYKKGIGFSIGQEVEFVTMGFVVGEGSANNISK